MSIKIFVPDFAANVRAVRWQLARKSPLDLERTRVRGQLLSIFFLFFHLLRPSATWPNGFVLFFFPGVGRVKEDHKTGPGLPWDNGL